MNADMFMFLLVIVPLGILFVLVCWLLVSLIRYFNRK